MGFVPILILLLMRLLSVFPLWLGWKSGKRVSNGSDEGILNSIHAIKWRITRFSMPFDQGSRGFEA